MPAGEEIPIGSRWLHGQVVYEILALRPIEPGCPAWGAHRLVLATPEGEDRLGAGHMASPHWTEIHDENATAAA